MPLSFLGSLQPADHPSMPDDRKLSLVNATESLRQGPKAKNCQNCKDLKKGTLFVEIKQDSEAAWATGSRNSRRNS